MNMATASICGSAQSEIIHAVVELSLSFFPDRLLSIVLTGSLAREEGTWLNMGARTRLAGDAEFLLVFEDTKSLPPSESTNRLCADVEARLADQDIEAKIDISPVEPRYLRLQKPHIFAFELITHGRVIWGDEQILNWIPRFTATEIPVEDGFRTLLNRMTELVEALSKPEKGSKTTDIANYRSMKLSLDMATSYLLFAGIYEPTYRGRARRLSELPAFPVVCPIPVQHFAARVQKATQHKLGERGTFGSSGRAELRDLINDLHLLWRWELESLIPSESGTSDKALMNRWVASQHIKERVRGWASVVRRHGVAKSLRHLPRWTVGSLTCSPRRALYAAVSELIFAIPDMYERPGCSMGDESRWDQLRLQLPVSEPPNRDLSGHSWQRLGLALGWNYHHFLESTRS